MNLYKGRKIWHKTLGPMEIHSTRYGQRTIYAKLIRDRNETVELIDDFGNTISLNPPEARQRPVWYTNPIDRVYQIKNTSCWPIKDAELTPVQRKIRMLWNESNWVKNHKLRY